MATLGVAAGGMLAACGNSEGQQAAADGEATAEGGQPIDSMTWGLPAEPFSMDYAFAYDYETNAVVTNILDSLLRFTPDGQLVPHLAESWSHPNDTTYVYKLREGVLFHDGSELTAEDAAFSMRRHLDPELGSYQATFFESVTSIEATGPLEVTVMLSRTDVLWQYAAATTACSISKKAFLEEHGDQVGSPAIGIMGTGPYRFVSWDHGQSLVIERFDEYWRDDVPGQVRQAVYRVLSDRQTLLAALENGDIDGTFGLSGQDLKHAEEVGGLHVVTAPGYGFQGIGFNVHNKPWDDKRVRQAIAYAIDRDGILQSSWGGDGAVVDSVFPPAMWTYSREAFEAAYEELPDYSQNLDRARELIAEAGAEGGQASVLYAFPHQEIEAVALQAACREIGLEVTPEKLTTSEFFERINAEDRPFDAWMSSWGANFADPVDTLAHLFPSSAPLGKGYENDAVDELSELAVQESDDDTRAGLVIEAQQILMDELPILPFYSPASATVLRDNIHGYQPTPLYFWASWLVELSGREEG